MKALSFEVILLSKYYFIKEIHNFLAAKFLLNLKNIETIIYMLLRLPLLILLFLTACQPSDKNIPQILNSKQPLNIDGKDAESVWSKTSWKAIDQKWVGPDYSETDFQGRYKVLWDANYIYVFATIVDDVLIDSHKDGLVKYWDDDCLEIFIDADASGGDHQYNYNAFAYHIALDGKVTDIGIDSLPHYYNHVTSKRITEGSITTWEAAIKIYDDSYVYEGQNTPIKLSSGHELGFAIAYCDNDRSIERENFIGSAIVEGKDKNRGWIDAGVFDTFVLE